MTTEPGRELDAAVAQALGWQWRWWRVAGSNEPVRALFPPDADEQHLIRLGFERLAQPATYRIAVFLSRC